MSKYEHIGAQPQHKQIGRMLFNLFLPNQYPYSSSEEHALNLKTDLQVDGAPVRQAQYLPNIVIRLARPMSFVNAIGDDLLRRFEDNPLHSLKDFLLVRRTRSRGNETAILDNARRLPVARQLYFATRDGINNAPPRGAEVEGVSLLDIFRQSSKSEAVQRINLSKAIQSSAILLREYHKSGKFIGEALVPDLLFHFTKEGAHGELIATNPYFNMPDIVPAQGAPLAIFQAREVVDFLMSIAGEGMYRTQDYGKTRELQLLALNAYLYEHDENDVKSVVQSSKIILRDSLQLLESGVPTLQGESGNISRFSPLRILRELAGIHGRVRLNIAPENAPELRRNTVNLLRNSLEVEMV